MSQIHHPSRPPFSFDGLKFLVSILVPQRIKILIKNHKGIVTNNEIEANAVILNPKRNVTSTGISYVWIEDCIREGRRIDEEKYRLQPISPEETARKEAAIRSITATSQLQRPARKHTRNHFTSEDDKILIRWIRKQQRKANESNVVLSIKGNVIYKELEKEHPNHTYHSWRERWIKHLAPRVSLDNLEGELQTSPPPTQSQAARQQVAKRPAQTSAATEDSPVEADASTDHQAPVVTGDNETHNGQEKSAGMFFMRDEHYCILKRARKHQVQISNGVEVSEAEFFQSLHTAFPRIATDEWRSMYRELKSWYEKSFPENPRNETDAAESASDEPVEPRQRHDDDDGAQVEEPENTEIPEIPEAQEESAGDADGDFDGDAILADIDTQLKKQEEFLAVLALYNKHMRVYIPSSFLIGGRYLESFSLSMAVQEQGANNFEEIDWPKIAESLGYSNVDYPDLHEQIAGWYKNNLKEFDEYMKEWAETAANGESNDDEEEGEGEDDEVEESDKGEEGSEGGEDADAVDAAGGGKEDAELLDYQSLPQDSSTSIFSSAKKRIYALAFPNKDPAVNAKPVASSPSKRVRFIPPATDGGSDAEGGGDDDDDDDDEFEPVGTRSATRHVVDEPETQDFALDQETQQVVDMDRDLEGEDDVDDVASEDAGPSTTAEASTPSQQLQAEDVVATPPRALSGRITRSKTPTASQAVVQRAAETPRRPSSRANGSKKGGRQGN